MISAMRGIAGLFPGNLSAASVRQKTLFISQNDFSLVYKSQPDPLKFCFYIHDTGQTQTLM